MTIFMRAKIFAILREWNILIGFCLILGGGWYIAFVSSMSSESAAVAPTAASSQPPASQVASKDSAPAAPQSSPAARAPVDSATPGQPSGTPDAWPRLSSTTKRPGHLRHSDERSSGATRCSLGVGIEHPRPGRRCGERPSSATRYSNTPNTDWRDGCRRRCGDRPPSLQKMPSLPLAGGRQEHGWP